MACVNGKPRLLCTLEMMERDWTGRYSVRWPAESRGAAAAERASRLRRRAGSAGRPATGKRGAVFAISSPYIPVLVAASSDLSHLPPKEERLLPFAATQGQ